MADQKAQAASNNNSQDGFRYIRWDAGGTVAHLTLNRPSQNVLNMEMMDEISRALEQLHGREEVRLILLDSACQGYFSAGAGAEGYTTAKVFQMMEKFHLIFETMLRVAKPVLAVVNGVASAGGCELAAFADIVIATEKARFVQPEIKLGVFPPLGAVVYPRMMGPKRAMELLLTGEALDAKRATEFGLVNRVVPEKDLAATVKNLVERISNQSGPVLSLAKRVIFEGTWLPFGEALKKAQDIYLHELYKLEDAQEGLRALIEKRKPVWKNK